ncbi:hypothetical protein [Aestuariimicrobium ganziense]|uniref:hypothetical protein n=1 Tax=Aestuariimicrobium ganziense TaxID=2773677 RepID=UPI0019445BB0|nr:hypothetical protein [Aestuariimicrobium ganziense]
MSQNAEDARRRLELSQSHARGETAAAQKLVDDFVREMTERGIPTERLRARLFSGQEVKTDKRGWYIRKNKSLAIGEDGNYYPLVVPGSLMDRLRGVRLQAAPPPLVVNRGGRDGESGDLAEFLAKRLAEG